MGKRYIARVPSPIELPTPVAFSSLCMSHVLLLHDARARHRTEAHVAFHNRHIGSLSEQAGGTDGAEAGRRDNDLFVMEQSCSPAQPDQEPQGVAPAPVLQPAQPAPAMQAAQAAGSGRQQHMKALEDASEEESQQTSIQGLPSPGLPERKAEKPQPPVRPGTAPAAFLLEVVLTALLPGTEFLFYFFESSAQNISSSSSSIALHRNFTTEGTWTGADACSGADVVLLGAYLHKALLWRLFPSAQGQVVLLPSEDSNPPRPHTSCEGVCWTRSSIIGL